uniref:Large ribosomal subunit protein bL20c n=1 Tax=Bulboplastis apyrenoidosa TaxID=1070855 RepID=A0A1X9PVJ9_9RHOD|nr:50S ribosomal protein L20 [Bulboplastis apyrenoidosa]ARO90733.1 50S ribosomal protein L20 [Bulboplastis apyrenoidosa]
MTRVKRGNVARKRRKKIFKLAKGFRGTHSKLFRVAKQQVVKSLRYAYIGRKQKKRTFRRLWIVRVNAETRKYGITYCKFISLLKKEKISINRKILAQIATIDMNTFEKLVKMVMQ